MRARSRPLACREVIGSPRRFPKLPPADDASGDDHEEGDEGNDPANEHGDLPPMRVRSSAVRGADRPAEARDQLGLHPIGSMAVGHRDRWAARVPRCDTGSRPGTDPSSCRRRASPRRSRSRGPVAAANRSGRPDRAGTRRRSHRPAMEADVEPHRVADDAGQVRVRQLAEVLHREHDVLGGIEREDARIAPARGTPRSPRDRRRHSTRRSRSCSRAPRACRPSRSPRVHRRGGRRPAAWTTRGS